MDENGLQAFSFHRHDNRYTAEALRPRVALDRERRDDGLTALDAEAAARRYLAEAFASRRLPTFNEVTVDGQPSELMTLGTEALPLTGTKTVKFRQVCRNVPVYGSLVTVELDENNELLSLNSALGDPSGVDPLATVSPAQAADVIARQVGRTRESLGSVPSLRYYFDPSRQRWHLAYIAKNVRKTGAPLAAMSDYVVDAHDGTVIAELPRTQRITVEDSALDARRVLRRFHCQQDGGAKQLIDDEYNVHTYDFSFRDLLREENALPGRHVSLPPEPWSAAAVSAHANAVDVARFLRDVLKRDGLDNRGGPLVSSINCCDSSQEPPPEWNNAAWTGYQMVYGQRRVDGELVTYALASDVVAHEILHGVTEHTARLEYRGQTGALSESISDIGAIIATNLAEPDVSKWNWQMGEELDVTSGVPLRDLSDPARYGQPAHMREYQNLPLSYDAGGVHINSGIHNKAAYNILTARDPAGQLVFDRRSVAALFYLSMTQYLSRTSLFRDSRRGVELAARSLFRNDPALELKLQAIAAAFDAVGITTTPEAVAGREIQPAVAPAAEARAVFGEALQGALPSLIVPYDPDFLGDGYQIPFPVLTDPIRAVAFDRGRVFDYVHYSLVMNERRRTALYTACNVDASQTVRMGRKGVPWVLDPRVPAQAQLGPRYYANNPWDRGHLVRREDPLWGPVRVAREANAATFYYTNAAPQHENFNQDEWLVLEDWVLDHATDFSYRLCVLTGPVLLPDDPSLLDAQIPAAFWKIVALRDATADGDDLSVVAFAMKQLPMATDKLGKHLLVLQRYQVTVQAIEEWTGLDFGELKNADELAWASQRARMAEPDTVGRGFRPIRTANDIVFSGDSRRALGRRIRPVAAMHTH